MEKLHPYKPLVSCRVSVKWLRQSSQTVECVSCGDPSDVVCCDE